VFQKGETGFGDVFFMHSEPALNITFSSLHFLAGLFLGELAVHGLVGEVVVEGQFYVAFLVHDGGTKVFVYLTDNQFGVGAKQA